MDFCICCVLSALCIRVVEYTQIVHFLHMSDLTLSKGC
jgi:hypothetical protein